MIVGSSNRSSQQQTSDAVPFVSSLSNVPETLRIHVNDLNQLPLYLHDDKRAKLTGESKMRDVKIYSEKYCMKFNIRKRAFHSTTSNKMGNFNACNDSKWMTSLELCVYVFPRDTLIFQRNFCSFTFFFTADAALWCYGWIYFGMLFCST